MKDLKCSLKECKYNQGFCCVAKDIEVDETAKCVTYTVDARKVADRMFEIGTEVAKPNYSVDTAIGCDAMSCLFNKGHSCIANGITVLGNTDSGANLADCATYTPKD